MQIEGIDYFVFEVSDLERAIEFYRDILSLNHLGTAPERGWAEFAIGANILALRSAASAEFYRDKFNSDQGYILEDGAWNERNRSPHPGPSLALRVADVQQAVAELRANNVSVVQQPFDSDVCHVAVFHDPDGNAIFLHRRHDFDE